VNFGRDAKQRQKRFFIFIACSLFLHLFFLLALPYIDLPKFEAEKNDQLIVDLDPALLQQIAQQQKMQIVESEESPNKEAPKDAKYLGERNQTVEKETKAKSGVTFSKQGGVAQETGRGTQQKFTLKNLAPSQKITPPTKEEGDEYREKIARQHTPEGGQAGAQASSTSDYLNDTKEGDRTLLNTKEFVYFSYYRRIRERLELAWNSRLQATLQQYLVAGRQLATEKNYVTKVIVVLDRHGRITAVQLMEGSGARDLDQAAVDAFNSAGPFPDPPSGLIDRDGTIKIPWSFVLQS
jgi:TonB family protein